MSLVDHLNLNAATPIDPSKTYELLHQLDPSITINQVLDLCSGDTIGIVMITFQPRDYTLLTGQDDEDDHDEP